MASNGQSMTFPVVLLLVFGVSVIVCRQMCYSCNYVGNILEQGYECVTYPKNWTYGNWRVRCASKCTTQSIYSKETKKATYMARGCSGSLEVPEDNCEEDDLNIRCYFTCQSHYCNDGPGYDDKYLELMGGATTVTSVSIAGFAMLLCITAINMCI